jgi:D-alanine-D-alanine ligase
MVFSDPNSTSGMAPSSFMFHQAAEEGLGPTELVGRIVDLAVEAHAAKRGPLA